MNTVSMHSATAQDLDLTAYNTFVEGLELASVDIVKLHAERTTGGAAERTKFDLTASYMQDGAVIHYRYDLTVYLTDNEGASMGNASASVLVTARTAGASDTACIERFGATSGALIAHPYLREAIASSAQRIDFPNVLLPAIKYQPDGEARGLAAATPCSNRPDHPRPEGQSRTLSDSLCPGLRACVAFKLPNDSPEVQQSTAGEGVS